MTNTTAGSRRWTGAGGTAYFLLLIFTLAFLASFSSAQEKTDQGPSDPKAQKTYQTGIEYLHKRMVGSALDEFKKADKQDGGHCTACHEKMIKYGAEYGDWKTAELGAQGLIADAKDPKATAIAHYEYGMLLLSEGLVKQKEADYARAHEELSKALAAYPSFPGAVFADGRALAYLKQDDAAKARFEQFVKMRPEGDAERQRAELYIAQPEMARARMAPAFSFVDSAGQTISLDSLKGKVVLIDFWATWCEPCREALPRVKNIVKKFDGQPFVVLSISLDDNEQKWKDFIAANGMTWPQYRDAGFSGPLAKMFGIQAIPHTFTVDAYGVLQDEHIGDASIEGKLKKLVAQAQQMQPAVKPN